MTKLARLAAGTLALALIAAATTARAADPAAPAFIPPYVLSEIAKRGNAEQRQRAERQLERDRALLPGAEGQLQAPSAALLPRGIYDAHHRTGLPGTLVWKGPSARLPPDRQVIQAAKGQAATIGFWQAFAHLNLGVPGSVHYDVDYDNAYWNGSEMVFGDGDGETFRPLTCCIEIVGHERTHGISQKLLAYHNQSGALNESMSDVFGSLTLQHAKHQTAAQASWLIGDGLLEPGIHGRALRDMLHPGTAYDDPLLGKDPQPATMAAYVHLPDTSAGDWGGVHYNSGIPNRAFVLSALALGGHAWDQVGRIWYAALTGSHSNRIGFADFANLTVAKAKALYGAGAAMKVTQAWRTVGVLKASGAQVAAE